MKRSGYQIQLYFLWLSDADLAVKRVANRARQGGHHVPEEDIRRRYRAGIRSFWSIYAPLADEWQLRDSSRSNRRLIAFEDEDGRLVFDPTSFAGFESEGRKS